jgi:hypothetical protein
MGVIYRRQIRLVQAEMQGINVEERRWLRTQGVDRPEELPMRHFENVLPKGEL